MIRVDIKQYIRDHMWFGYYYDPRLPGPAIRVNSKRISDNWAYSQWWTLRLWPCLREGKVVPKWWMAIFDYFGYEK